MPLVDQFAVDPHAMLWRGPIALEDEINQRRVTPRGGDLWIDLDTAVFQHAHRYFTVRETPPGQGHLCFYLPWENHKYAEITIDPSRDLFFTAELSGCTMAFQRDAGFHPSVLHIGANVRNKDAAIAEWCEFLDPARPAAVRYYRYDSDDDETATCLGKRKGNGWTFYVQRRQIGYKPVIVRRPPGGGPVRREYGVEHLEIPGMVKDVLTYVC